MGWFLQFIFNSWLSLVAAIFLGGDLSRGAGRDLGSIKKVMDMLGRTDAGVSKYECELSNTPNDHRLDTPK